MSTEELKHAGGYRIQKCKLTSSSGLVFSDFEKVVTGINIFENIFTNALSGTVEVVDTANLPTNMPLTGQDFLELKLVTPGLDDEPIVNHVFCINQITVRTEVSVGSQFYLLSIVTPELLRSNRTRVSASYTDTNSNIVDKVLKDKQLLGSVKKIQLENTSGNRKHIVPNLRPFDFIKNLTRESISAVSSSSPHYMFYENCRGFNFVTLDSLYNKPVVAEFETQDKCLIDTHGKFDVESDLKNILSFSISSTQDTLIASRGGMLSSKLTVYNIFTKSYKNYTHNYFRDFKKYGRIDDNPIYNNTKIDEQGNTIADFPNANINLHPTSNDGGLDVSHDGSFADNQSENWLLSLRSKLVEMSLGMSLEMIVHGRANLAVGDKINLALPVAGKTDKGEEIDKVYEGDFLVTQLRHQFDRAPEVHMIHMSVVKDGIPKPHQIINEVIEPTLS